MFGNLNNKLCEFLRFSIHPKTSKPITNKRKIYDFELMQFIEEYK
jgi:hypothetical protein